MRKVLCLCSEPDAVSFSSFSQAQFLSASIVLSLLTCCLSCLFPRPLCPLALTAHSSLLLSLQLYISLYISTFPPQSPSGHPSDSIPTDPLQISVCGAALEAELSGRRFIPLLFITSLNPLCLYPLLPRMLWEMWGAIFKPIKTFHQEVW